MEKLDSQDISAVAGGFTEVITDCRFLINVKPITLDTYVYYIFPDSYNALIVPLLVLFHHYGGNLPVSLFAPNSAGCPTKTTLYGSAV